MKPKRITDSEKVSQIHELYSSLSEDGKEVFIQEILNDEELMARLLQSLLEISEDSQDAFEGKQTFVNFLRKVKE